MGEQYKLREAALACGIALSLALHTSGALAFSTEPVAPPQTTPAQPAPMSPFGQNLSLPNQGPQASIDDPIALSGKTGTELTIPGIGSVGTIPKLDFGLELLYGGKDLPATPPMEQQRLDGEMQIKGTLSHKF
jgi:hypothetical protein